MFLLGTGLATWDDRHTVLPSAGGVAFIGVLFVIAL
jgi:hypothetical protein